MEVERTPATKSAGTVELLWEYFQGESSDDVHSKGRPLEDLAVIYFGREFTEEDLLLLEEGLEEDRIYFKRKGKMYVSQPESRVSLLLEQREKAQESTKKEEKVVECLKGLAKLSRSTSHVVPRRKLQGEGEEEALQRCFTLLQQFYLAGEGTPSQKEAKRLFKKAGITDPALPFGILVRHGIWERDEDLNLLKHRIPQTFPPQVVEESQKISRLYGEKLERLQESQEGVAQPIGLESPGGLATDCRTLRVLTIDEEGTTDRDDGLSLQMEGGRYLLGIHIALPSLSFPTDSPLGEEARSRGTSLYFPDRKIPMLPESVTSLFSLDEGKVRPALSCFVSLQEDGVLLGYSFSSTLIKVWKNLSYGEVDRLLAGSGSSREESASAAPEILQAEGATPLPEKQALDPGSVEVIGRLHTLAAALRKKRVQQGAVIFDWPKIEITVHPDSKRISLSPFNACAEPPLESPGQILVSEMMVLYNSLAAEFLRKHEVPALFRSQPPRGDNEEGDSGGSRPASYEETLVAMWKMLKKMKRVETSTIPSPHHGLGLSLYVQMTSPLRRYPDLVMQRQLGSFLGEGRILYSTEELESLIGVQKEWVEMADRIERERRRYLLLKYLQEHSGEMTEAVVLEERRRGSSLVFLPAYGIDLEIPYSFREGERLHGKIEVIKLGICGFEEGRLDFVPVL